MNRPLASLIRPQTLDDVVGQKHLVGPRGILRRVIKSDYIPNMIFYGPSGVGKTTIASIIAKQAGRNLHILNGTAASTKDIKEVIAEVGTLQSTAGVILYLDEIQYLNKKQQQSLLEHIENGDITLIASTTENPYFYIYNAILSRCTVFEFLPVDKDDIMAAVSRGFEMLAKEKGEVLIDDEIIETIAVGCGGDVRKALNAVELAYHSAEGEPLAVDIESVKTFIQKSNFRYDRDSDAHYDILSAFHKSMRGSDPDATLHYLARLIVAGDLPSICRRLLACASEDVGLAYSNCAVIVKSCVDSALQLGFPEAQLPLAHAALSIATSPKSNSVSSAISAAVYDVQNIEYGDIPTDIKDAHYSGAKKLGHGQGYVYPHGKPNNYVKQQYLPDKLLGTVYYEYGSNKYEQSIKAFFERIKGEADKK